MHLRVEPAQTYTLFPTNKPGFFNHQAPSLPFPYPSTLQPEKRPSAFESLLPPPPPSPPLADQPVAHMMAQLSDFAAFMVYVMWHARRPANRQACAPSMYRPSFSALTFDPSPAFKKFCLQILTATQLTESAIYLALKYIAILLQSNPCIEGAEGSEYRLFIVALILANKFLDDNTFTNKTWSDVSGMKVHDLNIMEAEFLEALDYNLFVRDNEFVRWKGILDICRDCAQYTSLDNPQQRQKIILTMLKDLGLYEDEQYRREEEEKRRRLQELEELKQRQRALWESSTSYHPAEREYQLFVMTKNQQQCAQRPGTFPPPIGRHPPQKQSSQLPPVGDHLYYNSNDLNRRLSGDCRLAPIQPSVNTQSSWDPFGYSIHSIDYNQRDHSYYSSQPFSQSIHSRTVPPLSWRNFN
ncbi:hypothetical protein DFQ28_007305 [Apophysomyces sp. BC1034]|nr:hypothetical protein DFQ30_004060 [Apophysomyces sp. BC1015]KAG0180547.1 hypothetical protein DFQ29_000500 [Apophysomyces sp. BC1021]KAG0186784.1 hypothetical protein DFQ28_007305 [Apophysomyces sp. BC1034]